jgi:hypothetical protein
MHTSIRIVVPPIMAVLELLFFLPGCNSKNERATNEIIEQTYNVDANASPRIANARGSIAIFGTDASAVRMRAVKSASTPGQLKDITVSVTAEPGDILIKTMFLQQKKKPFFAGGGAVDYTLYVPRTARIARLDLDDGKVSIDGIQNADVRANVVDGQLAIRNCCGNIKVGIGNGALDLIYGRCTGSQFSADAQVLNGNARLSIARGASFHVRGETLNGKITNKLAGTVELNGRPSRKIDMCVGLGGRSDVTLRVTSGDIMIVGADSD